MTLSHINEDNQPTMVDVGDKAVTQRTATAQALITFPSGILPSLESDGDQELQSRKGPVFQTAILAGIMGAKKTSELIPLCHQIPLEDCSIDVQVAGADQLRIRCTARATHKTGVEMEALTGAAVAALTIYDMCKALTHHIVISEVRLLEKRGGKRDVHDPR